MRPPVDQAPTKPPVIRAARPVTSLGSAAVRGGPRSTIVEALAQQPVVWLGSIRPDGLPHVVPMWFIWDGTSILGFSKPHAQKVRNVRAEPRVMVAVGDPDADFDVELIEGIAELVGDGPRDLPELFARKYGGLIDRAGITLGRYAEIYSQPIRIWPVHWLNWGGPGWTPRSTAA